MKPGIIHIKKMPGFVLFFLVILKGNCLVAQKIDATPEITALCNTDSGKVYMEFSPNGDNVHDKLSFKPVNMISMKVVIFDKDRNIFYQSDKLDAEWDGYDLKKQKAKPGIYFFIQTAQGLDGKQYEQKGCIKLTR